MKKEPNLQDELNEHAPFLKPFNKKESGLQVPDGYFDTIEASVFKQLDAIGATRRPAQPKSKLSLWQFLQSLWNPRFALSVAGVLAVLLSAWWFFGPNNTTIRDIETVAIVTAEDAESYLRNNVMELDPAELASALPAENPPAVFLETEKPNASGKINLSPEELEQLLRDLSDEELDNLML